MFTVERKKVMQSKHDVNSTAPEGNEIAASSGLTTGRSSAELDIPLVTYQNRREQEFPFTVSASHTQTHTQPLTHTHNHSPSSAESLRNGLICSSL